MTLERIKAVHFCNDNIEDDCDFDEFKRMIDQVEAQFLGLSKRGSAR